MAPDHPDIAQSCHNLAEDLRRVGQADRALELHQQAVAIFEKKLGPVDDSVAQALSGQAHDLVALGRAAQAVPLAERALTIHSQQDADLDDRAYTQWVLAQALWEAPPAAGRDPGRAIRLSEAALGVFEASNETVESPNARSWLEQRR
jgi:tetratricopeptide (TPR) repeat protein